MKIPFFDIGIRVNPGKIDEDHETIYEGVSIELPDGTEVGLALVKVDESGSEMHFHDLTTETYVLLSGSLSVYRADINTSIEISSAGGSLTIPADTVHSVRSTDGTAWFLVVSNPAWKEGDHHIYDGPPITH